MLNLLPYARMIELNSAILCGAALTYPERLDCLCRALEGGVKPRLAVVIDCVGGRRKYQQCQRREYQLRCYVYGLITVAVEMM